MTNQVQNIFEIDNIQVASGEKDGRGVEAAVVEVVIPSGDVVESGEAEAELGLAGKGGDGDGSGGWRMITRAQKKGKPAQKSGPLNSQRQVTFDFATSSSGSKKRKTESSLTFEGKPTMEEQMQQLLQHIIKTEEEQQRQHEVQLAQVKEIQELKALVTQLAGLLKAQAPAQIEVRKDQTYSAIAQKGLPPKSLERPALKVISANASPPAKEQTEQWKKVDLNEDHVVSILVNQVNRTSKIFTTSEDA